ncbi:MAG: hypothetical protein OEM24_03845 [Paracoccaceae bacterium]|nr:hypothetical protein [Paracoccaceae bacterium]
MSGSAHFGRVARNLTRLGAVALIAWLSLWALDWVKLASDAMPGAGGPFMYYGILMLALLLYAVLLALPFVPGVEVGIMILAMQGPGAALPVYLATLVGLSIAFGAGERVPAHWLAGVLADLRLERAARLIEQAAPLSCEERLGLLRERLPARLGAALLGWRYLLLALVLNVPGNWLLGGGGGIMLIAGLSGLFRPLGTLATIALAVAPVPLLVWALGLKLF